MTVLEKLSIFYNSYVLTILTVGYVAGELGHYLIGITSKQTAIDLDYGDHACQQNSTMFRSTQLPVPCSEVTQPERYVHRSSQAQYVQIVHRWCLWDARESYMCVIHKHALTLTQALYLYIYMQFIQALDLEIKIT